MIGRIPLAEKHQIMVRPLHQLTQEALKLSAEDRLALATELIDSIEDGSDPEWEEAWLKERSARRARGSAAARPWREVRKDIMDRLAKR